MAAAVESVCVVVVKCNPYHGDDYDTEYSAKILLIHPTPNI